LFSFFHSRPDFDIKPSFRNFLIFVINRNNIEINKFFKSKGKPFLWKPGIILISFCFLT